jgi:hypothetical protein
MVSLGEPRLWTASLLPSVLLCLSNVCQMRIDANLSVVGGWVGTPQTPVASSPEGLCPGKLPRHFTPSNAMFITSVFSVLEDG